MLSLDGSMWKGGGGGEEGGFCCGVLASLFGVILQRSTCVHLIGTVVLL